MHANFSVKGTEGRGKENPIKTQEVEDKKWS